MSYVKPERRDQDMWDGMPYQVDIYGAEGGLKRKIARLSTPDDALLVWRQAIVRYPSERVLLRHRVLVVRDSFVD